MSGPTLFIAVVAALLMTLLLYPAWRAGRGSSKDASTPDTPYDFSFRGLRGEAIPLDQFRGKLLMVVNTASRCGFNQQFEGLQALHERYQSRGLVLIGVPSNDFNQEPDNCEEILRFTTDNFRVSFPMTDKEHVKGDAAHPFYRWVRATLGLLAAPRWNFYKYLISPEGKAVAWFSSKTGPENARLVEAIERHLPAM